MGLPSAALPVSLASGLAARAPHHDDYSRWAQNGRRPQTVVEAVNYDPKTRVCQAVAGWGERTDWYRNLQAQPAIEIQVGSRRYVPQQHFLSTKELLTLLQDYEHRHPRGLRLLFRHLGYPYDGSPEGLHAIAQVMRGVEFRPEAEKK